MLPASRRGLHCGHDAPRAALPTTPESLIFIHVGHRALLRRSMNNSH